MFTLPDYFYDLNIFATGRNKIKGLTTAAGLWASACLGLALGIVYYSGAFIAGALIFISLALLPKVASHCLWWDKPESQPTDTQIIISHTSFRFHQ